MSLLWRAGRGREEGRQGSGCAFRGILEKGLKERGSKTAGECLYFGGPGEDAKKAAREADVLFVGFWTDKGTCDEETGAFLRSLHGQKVFLFGTAGFGESQEYFSRILACVSECLDGTNDCIGSYMCQGRMPEAVRRRYESMMEKEPERMAMLIRNFDNALSHPDEKDLEGLLEAALIIWG